MTIALRHITGLILAGGKGSRMGHVDKGLQSLHGQPLVMHIMKRLKPQVHSLAINANRHHDHYAQFGLPLWPDLLSGWPGPLAGLHSGLTHCSTDYLMAVPCDAPLLPPDLVHRLAAAISHSQAAAAIAVTGTVQQQQRHPVFCLLRKTLLPALSDYLQREERQMARWFSSIEAVDVYFQDDAAFSNINTLQALHALEGSATQAEQRKVKA